MGSKWKKAFKNNELFSSLAGVAFETILTTISSPDHTSRSGKKPLLAELLIPGLGQYLLKRKYAIYFLIGYACWLLVDVVLILSVCFIPLVLCVELAIRAICLKILTRPQVCEYCGTQNPFSALYCSHCNNSFDKNFIVCPNCRELTRKGTDFCDHCEADIAHIQSVKLCPHCEKENAVEAQFCRVCGADLTIERAFSTCTKCNQPLKPGDLFCSQCGTNVIDTMQEDNYSSEVKNQQVKYNQDQAE